MLAPVTRVLFCLALCMVLLSSWGCQKCIEYQDIASVIVDKNRVDEERNIDSVAIIANDSIIGCREYWYGFNVIGSKTHHVKFPIYVRVQLFSQGDLWKEFFVKMEKNSTVTIFTGHGCSYPSYYEHTFSRHLESAKEQNRFIELSFMEDYCWLLEKMVDSRDDTHCTEMSVDGKQALCR